MLGLLMSTFSLVVYRDLIIWIILHPFLIFLDNIPLCGRVYLRFDRSYELGFLVAEVFNGVFLITYYSMDRRRESPDHP